MTTRELERFESKYEERLGCWAWTAAMTGGIGVLQRENGGGTRSARVLSYEHFVGTVPHGHEVQTTCGLRSCVNPDHLTTASRGSAAAKSKPKKTHCKRGHSLIDAYVTSDGRQDCRICGRDRRRKYKSAHPRTRDLRKLERVEVACPICERKRILTQVTAKAASKKPCPICKSEERKRKTLERRGSEQLTCRCGEKFYRNPAYIKKDEGRELFCSTSCWRESDIFTKMREDLSRDRKGSRNPGYNSGRRVNVHITGWSVRHKGEDCCRNCGKMGKLHLHHIIPRGKWKSGEADLRNGVPLCHDCHFGWHGFKITLYRDMFTEDEWNFVSSAQLTGQRVEAWLDDRYPIR